MILWQENNVLVWGGCQLRTSHLCQGLKVNSGGTIFRVHDKESAETVRKASMGTLSADDLRNLSGGKAANCESPTPAANVDMMSFNKDMTEQMEARSTAKENLGREWLTLKAMQLEIKEIWTGEKLPFATAANAETSRQVSAFFSNRLRAATLKATKVAIVMKR